MSAGVARITGIGACTPIGQGAWASLAAARAGLCGFRQHPYLIDTAGEPMRVAAVPWLDAAMPVAERCLAMLLPALEQALAGVPATRRVALELGLPPPRPGREGDLAEWLKDAIARRFGRRVAAVRTHECGHAAGLLALDAALKRFEGGSVEVCLVAGVDSYLAAETLEWIEACDQLHGGGPLNNAWGYIPGEAAGVLCVEPVRGEGDALAEVMAVGLGREPCLIKTDTVCIGAGLTEALRAALAALPAGERIDDVYCDMNGEAYRADEYGFSCLRTKQHFRAAADFVAPADCWGDVGAAGAPLHAMQAIAACRKGYANGTRSLVWASSEGGERGAAVLRATLAPRE